jgi:nitroreductase
MSNEMNTEVKIGDLNNPLIKSLNWRFAVKKFDENKKVNEVDVQQIKDAIRLAPSSFGLQPFKVLIIQDKELLAKLKGASMNQTQFDGCSHLFVFIANADMHGRITEYCDLAEHKSQGMFNRLKSEATMRGFAVLLGATGRIKWASEQTYLAAGLAIAQCSLMNIDSCPMGGFNEAEYKEILNLKEDENAVLILPIGYRSEGPAYQRTRFDESVLFENRNK